MQFTHTANPVRVNAATILDVTEGPNGNLLLRLSDGRNYTADTSMTVRYYPVVGDYLVTQEDCYEYLNPKDVFERKYSATHPAQQIADAVGGTITNGGVLPDGSGFAVVSSPLPANHWLTQPGYDEPPAPFLMGTNDPQRADWADKIRAAAKYAVRGATINGTEEDFDPDAMVQNMVVGMLGYFTPDGLSRDGELVPDPVNSVVQSVADTSGLPG
jgi:hypothetical protein